MPSRLTRNFKEKENLPFIAQWSCWFAIVIATLLYYQTTPVNVISWDVYGYYVYLPGIFNFGDAPAYGFVGTHFENYPISANLYQLQEIKPGVFAPIYTLGMAILWLPFFLIADGITQLTQTYPRDGMSTYYQWAIIAACWFYAAVGLFYLRKVLQHFFKPKIAAITLATLVLGTNYFHYVAYECGMSHSYLFSLYAILLYYTIKWHQKPTWRYTFLIGLPIGLLCVARPSEAISFFIPLLYGVYNWETLQGKIKLLKQHYHLVFLLAITGVFVIAPQMIYWKTTLDTWVFNGYAEHHFDFLQPHLWDGFFSYRKGWLLYTPIMTLALVGIPFLWKKPKPFFWSVLIFSLINIYIVFSWHIWWYASSFGARGVIQSYSVLALPLASILTFGYYRCHRVLSYFLSILLVGMILLNQFQDWQYRNKILKQDQTTKTYYWEVFGKTNLDLHNLIYMDVDEKLPNAESYDRALLAEYQADTTNVNFLVDETIGAEKQPPNRKFAGTAEWIVPAGKAEQFKKSWLAISAKVNPQGDKFSNFKAARLVCSVTRKGQAIKWTGLRFQHILPSEKWNTIRYFTQLPATLQENDRVKIYLWNTSPDTILFTDIKLERVK